MSLNVPHHGIFDGDLKKRFGFVKASESEDIPELPGIYAWYLPMRGDDGTDLPAFLKSLEKSIAHFAPVTKLEADGTQRKLQIERNVPEFDLSSAPIQRLATSLSSSQVQQLSKLVLMLSFLTEPFYVGMTDASNGLRNRIQQHLQSVRSFDEDKRWTGAFRTRIAHVLGEKEALKRCLVAFVTLPEELVGTDASRLLEHILIRTVSPSQSQRG
jgi:hypothetical protein